MRSYMLDTAGARLAYDVYEPARSPAAARTLLMIGQPMTASGFATLASHFPDRMVVTYDPRGQGRSTRHDGRVDNAPTVQAEDVHALIETLGGGPVEMFASSGGAVTALALATAHAADLTTLVAHEPPLISVLPDAEEARRARAQVHDAYARAGLSAGMAAFIAMTSWRGEFTDDYFRRESPDPGELGLTMPDDGTRDDPLLSDRSWAINDYRLDRDALLNAPTNVLLAYGEESRGTFCARASLTTADLLGRPTVVFPSHHGGFAGPESGYPGQPKAFAAKLREVLDDARRQA